MSDLLGVIGRPITGSAGQFVFNSVFDELEIDALYLSLDVAPETLDRFIAKGANRFKAFNVTSPLKTRVFSHCHSHDLAASNTGSVNLVVRGEAGLNGFNTDVVGFRDLLEKSGINVTGKTITILGTGGAARSALYTLKTEYTPGKICMASRDSAGKDKTQTIDEIPILSYSDIPPDTDLIVNCTPPDSQLLMDEDLLNGMKTRNALDLVYGAYISDFAEQLRSRDWNVWDGSEMYIGQAVEAFHIVYGDDFGDIRRIFEQYYRQFLESET